MKFIDVVAAFVIRNRAERVFGHPVTWKMLGEVFDISDDAVRHRITSLKKKFNLVDDDAKSEGWNRKFLEDHTPVEERAVLNKMKFKPGDLVVDSFGGEWFVIEQDFDMTIPDELTVVGLVTDETMDGVVISNRLAREFCFDDEIELVDKEAQILKVSEESVLSSIVSDEDELDEPQHIITPNVLVVVRDGVPLTIDKNHNNYANIRIAMENKQWRRMFDLIDLKNTITKYSKGRITVENGKVLFDGEGLSSKLHDRMVNCLLEENVESLDALTAFLEKCDLNPDMRVVNRIYDFLQANDIRLDKDGDFYAYKRVRANYFDCHSGTMDNSPGKEVTMQRNKVNPNDHETCSAGLHVCSKSYLSSFYGDKVVLCKVNPRDVVSVPTDYNNAKMRVCRYEVIKDVTENFKDEVTGLNA